MSPRAFAIVLALIASLVALSGTRELGAMIGFLCGISIAFFLAPATFALQWIVQQIGLSISFEHLVQTLLAVYGLCVLFALYKATRSAAAGDLNAARGTGAKAALFAALPLIGYYSLRSLARAWP